MKTYTLRFRAVDESNFGFLKSGLKSVETRAATEKYRDIQPGDVLVLTCDGEKSTKTVLSVAIYPSIEEMFQHIPIEKVMPSARTIEEAKKEYYSYPGYKEKIAEHGILAMELGGPTRERAGALILNQDKVLLVHRKNEYGEYYVVPGGGVDEGETPQQAAEREVLEEAGLSVCIGDLLHKQDNEKINQRQYFFLAELKEDLGPGSEQIKWQEEFKQNEDNVYAFEWVALKDVLNLDLRPEGLKPAIKMLLADIRVD